MKYKNSFLYHIEICLLLVYNPLAFIYSILMLFRKLTFIFEMKAKATINIRRLKDLDDASVTRKTKNQKVSVRFLSIPIDIANSTE